MPNEAARGGFSRRVLLSSLPVGALALLSSAACGRPDERIFGLAASGIGAAAFEQSAATAEALGRHLDLLAVYDAFAWGQPLPTQLLDLIYAGGSVPEITWEPWNPDDGFDQPLYALAQIAGGRYDAYVAGWARQAATYDRRFLIRFAHEMNGNWYPWAVGGSGGTPEDYVAAYQRVRRIFDDAGAGKVEWVWCPNVIINDDADIIERCYPGDDLVDVVGVDGYNFGDDPGHRWTTPADLFGPTLNLVASIAPGKPLWINEIGSSDRGGDKSQWITDLFTFLKDTDVTGLVWFEANKPGEPDWRLTSTPATAAAAKAGLSSW